MRVAYREIAEKGFEGLRTREIAGAVGVNVATLHYYFPTKEDLIRAVVGHAMSRFQETLRADGTALERLRGHFQGLRRLARTEPELFAAMAELTLRASRDRRLASVIEKTNAYWDKTMRSLLRQARDEGALPSTTDPGGMATVVVAALKGGFMLPGPTTEGFDRTVREIERILGLREGVPLSEAAPRSARARSGGVSAPRSRT